MTHWAGIEDPYQQKDKEALDQAKDEDEKELGCEAFQIESSLGKLGHIEDEGSGKGVEAETISRKEVHEKPQEKG